MQKIYLIRHGLPDFPGGKRMCLGRTDLPLGPEGLAQAEAAAARLKGVPLAAVFASPLTRAVQTAQPLGLPVTVLPGLQELDAGEWDGLTFDRIRAEYPELYARRATDQTIPPPGSESGEAGLARFRLAMEAAVSSCSGDFAVVAHGSVIRLFLQSISGRGWKPGYGEIITLSYENGSFTLKEEEIHA